MSEITVRTKLFEDRIEQTILTTDVISEQVHKTVTKVLELESEQIQKALIKIGWQSPEKTNEVRELLELARRQLVSLAPDAALNTIQNILSNGS